MANQETPQLKDVTREQLDKILSEAGYRLKEDSSDDAKDAKKKFDGDSDDEKKGKETAHSNGATDGPISQVPGTGTGVNGLPGADGSTPNYVTATAPVNDGSVPKNAVGDNVQAKMGGGKAESAEDVKTAFKESIGVLVEAFKNDQQKMLDTLAKQLGAGKKEAAPSSRVNDEIAGKNTEAFKKAVEWFNGIAKRVSGIPGEYTWTVSKDEVMNRYFGVGYASPIPSIIETGKGAPKKETVTITGGDMPQYFANMIHRIPGGQIPINVRPYVNFVELTNQDRANWYKINKTTVYTITEGTEPTQSSQTVTKLTATPSIRGTYQRVGYTQVENAPFDIIQAVQDQMALSLINDEATDLLSTVYAAVSATNWVNASTGATITAGTGTSGNDDVASMTFKRDGLVAAKRLIRSQGHDIRPGNLVLFLHPKAYQELLLDTNLNNYYQWAVPEITASGVLESIYGVELVVANQVAAQTNTTNNTYQNILAVKGIWAGLASARDITYEAQKRNELQQILITGTQRTKTAVIDETSTCRISSAQ